MASEMDMPSDSVFRLIDNVSQLRSANDKMAKYTYDQIQPSAGTATGAGFTTGQIRFKWEHAATKWWFPSKCYLELKCSLNQVAGGQLVFDTLVAPNMDLAGNLFQQAEFLIGGKSVSKIGEYLPQVDVLKKRLKHSKAWLDGVGNSTLLMQPSAAARRTVNAAANAANVGRNVKKFGLTWQPPLSIFDVDVLPCGRYELILTPETQANFKKYAIEQVSFGAAVEPGTAYEFSVDSILFYVCTAEAGRLDNKEYYIDLESIKCQSTDGVGAPTTTQKAFDVSPSTSALTVAFQDNRAGNDVRLSRTKFICAANTDAKLIDTAISQGELGLISFFISYAGVNQPSPNVDPLFNPATPEDTTTRLYTETMMNAGLYWNPGSCETIEDYHARGSFYHFNFPKDPSDQSTRVIVNSQFRALDQVGGVNAQTATFQLLLFEHYKQVARIILQDGRVVDVALQDA
jgi:hypothetical protein